LVVYDDAGMEGRLDYGRGSHEKGEDWIKVYFLQKVENFKLGKFKDRGVILKSCPGDTIVNIWYW